MKVLLLERGRGGQRGKEGRSDRGEILDLRTTIRRRKGGRRRAEERQSVACLRKGEEREEGVGREDYRGSHRRDKLGLEQHDNDDEEEQ